jgi:carboxymethylenebutenolidase
VPDEGVPSELGALFDQHVALEFEATDNATIERMTEDPKVAHVPVLTGGRDTEELRAFYRQWFIPSWPDETEVIHVSRTVGTERVVDEMVIRFSHTRETPFLLPGIAPAGRVVEIRSLLAQIGLLDESHLPISGAAQSKALVDDGITLNELIARRP